ncbi:MAG TPA: MBL fold metallo-hydrolase [Pyrinomonadaceae bacterium]|jgi:glyoxylase-like metal-dependent hydrolase (beta-lactamase superfamily II)|nr:MBL fold metallo-hydrolase [Pyrinomonadaceae bacterium]
MKKQLLILLVFIACLGGAQTTAAQDWSKIEIKVTKVAGSVYMLEGAGGNIGVSVGPDGILIVDDEFAPLADKIKAALKTLGEGKLKFVLNTHYHGDHTGGNIAFGPDAPIIAQTNVRKRLSEEQKSKFFNRTTPASPKEALPVITFDQAVSVFFNGEEIKVIHFPHGHTDGDSVIFFTGSNVVHMGDDLFNGRFPVVDLEAGGDVEGMTKNVGDIISKLPAGVKIIPGHGALTDVEGLKSFHRMLLETTDIVRKRMAAGKTLDQIKAEGLPEEWKSWGSGFIKTELWLTLVYTSLSAKH